MSYRDARGCIPYDPSAPKPEVIIRRMRGDEDRLERSAIPALQLAYRKHVLNDDTVGWQELEDNLATALQECMGDEGFQIWLKAQNILE